MRRARLGNVALAALCASAIASAGAFAQPVVQPLGPARTTGQTVTPAFEGWYKNSDGTFSISFGYFNRNTREELDIPIGPNNNITGIGNSPDQGQPTHFMPQRAYGAFAVKVPADFGNKQIVWTLVDRGQTFKIPGSLKNLWQIDALQGEVGSDNTPPVVTMDSGGATGKGPGGIMSTRTLSVKVGTPLKLNAWVTDDGHSRGAAGGGRGGAGRGGRAGGGGAAPPVVVAPGVTVEWLTHQGPAKVTFMPAMPRPDSTTGAVPTTATFSAPGDYLLRLRANDASGVTGGGHAQCCWTNGFVKVKVTP